MSRVRIVATIGPSTANADTLRALMQAGMNVVRLNGSHNTLEWHAATVELVRSTLPEMPILFDIPGRKIRTGRLTHEPKFGVGDCITLTTATRDLGRDRIPVNYPMLHADLKVGNVILADDGTLRFEVVKIEGQDIVCRAQTPGTLRSHKGINVPLVKLSTPLITDRDRAMMRFASDARVDFVGISFVESAEHVDAVRQLTKGGRPRIVSKVENRAGCDNLREIVAATDAVMIDRGDLSAETGVETLGILQKKIILACKAAGKPVIVATEMLHSMIEHDFPTKAEISDITNAVLDGCGATMLSGETAIGKYPLEVVGCMRRIVDSADGYLQQKLDDGRQSKGSSVHRAIENAIALICRSLPVTKIIAVSRSGYAAQMIAAHQVRQPIIVVSDDRDGVRGLNLLPGVEAIGVKIPFRKASTDHIAACLEFLWRNGKLDLDDVVLVTAVGYPRSGNRMNLVQTHYVRDLRDALCWEVVSVPESELATA